MSQITELSVSIQWGENNTLTSVQVITICIYKFNFRHNSHLNTQTSLSLEHVIAIFVHTANKMRQGDSLSDSQYKVKELKQIWEQFGSNWAILHESPQKMLKVSNKYITGSLM